MMARNKSQALGNSGGEMQGFSTIKAEDEFKEGETGSTDSAESESDAQMSERRSPFSSTLDVLAQVASDTLRSEPSSHRKKRKLKQPYPESSRTLSLEQIRMLSDKQLVKMFSENEFDEMKKTYTYTCALLPESCQATYSSFGSELRAHSQIKAHLLTHVGDLLSKANRPDSETAKNFESTPVYVEQEAHVKKGKYLREALLSKAHSKRGRKPRTLPENDEQEAVEDEHEVLEVGAQIKVETDGVINIAPTPDHCYTTADDEMCMDVAAEETISVTSPAIMPRVLAPKTRVRPPRATPPPVVLMGSDELSRLMAQHIEHSPHKNHYPPMPKFELAQRGKQDIPEEDMSDADDDTPMPPVGTQAWQRRMALRYIRELKSNKRAPGALVCKICEDKTFTATATLLYHYRSHAGIKPFVCLICEASFTRQHSLNYHMLIHNNQSRFMCNQCSRQFRHPSHYKEHLRRHTGETPFACSECNMSFKTRNTYKRHLKARHGINLPPVHQLEVAEARSRGTRRRLLPDGSLDVQVVEINEDGAAAANTLEQLHGYPPRPRRVVRPGQSVLQPLTKPNSLLRRSHINTQMPALAGHNVASSSSVIEFVTERPSNTEETFVAMDPNYEVVQMVPEQVVEQAAPPGEKGLELTQDELQRLLAEDSCVVIRDSAGVEYELAADGTLIEKAGPSYDVTPDVTQHVVVEQVPIEDVTEHVHSESQQAATVVEELTVHVV